MGKPKVDGGSSTMLERHPLSEKYGPKMSQDELIGLGQDIKNNGQHDDIILFEGKVLAGWNRYIGCMQQGVKPRFKDMDAAGNPVAVAFGTNFVRRRLGSVQKAFFGAQYAVDTGAKQADVAKLVGCNINRLNQCVQLLKRQDESGMQQAIETLRENPDVTSGAFEEMMLELGIAKEAVARAPVRSNTFAGDDDDDILGGGGDDDLTGGAIDGLLGDDLGSEEDEPTDKASRRREIGEDSPPLPSVGRKVSNLTNPTETTVSRLAKAFRNLPAADQQTFVKFAWGKLQQALNAAINAGDVTYYAPGTDGGTSPAPTKGKKVSGDGLKAVKAAKASGKPDPSLIARGKPAEEDDLLASKKPAAKKAPAKKAAKKK